MRVTHIITRLILGGAQQNTVDSVLGLRQRPGLTLRLISGPTAGPEGSLESSLRLPELLTIAPHLVRPLHPWKDWLALGELTRLLRAQKPHLVHTHSGKAGILGRLAARRAGVRLVLHTVHGPSFGPFQPALANHFFRAVERHAASLTTHFVSVADAMTRQYVAAGVGRAEQFTRIYSGFAIEPFLAATNDLDFRKRLGLRPDNLVIGMIGRLFKLKGHDDLLAAAPDLVNNCAQIKFLLVGDGPWKRPLQDKARSLGLEEHFHFAGLVAPQEVPRYVGVMDMLVHLSRREGLARALPQALAAARPVVAYSGDGAAEVCLPEVTGFLVRPGDLHELVRRVLQLAQDSALRHRLGAAGQNLVRDRFPVERMVDELEALYRKLASTHGLGAAFPERPGGPGRGGGGAASS